MMLNLIKYYWRRWIWNRWVNLDDKVCEDFVKMGGPSPLACRDVYPYNKVYLIECHNEQWWYMYPNGRIKLAWDKKEERS